MKNKMFGTASIALMVAGAFFAGSANATLTGVSCGTSDVKVTSIAQYSDTTSSATLNTVASGLSIDSAACAGAYVGTDGFYPTTNLGYAGDGLLNGGVQTGSNQVLFPNPPGAFITPTYPLSDLDKDGQVDDPGWIMLGKYELVSGKWVFSPNAVGGDTSIVLSSFFSVNFTSGTYAGNWAFTPDATVAERAESILGKNYFDQFALVMKAGNEFAAYDFTSEQFGVAHPSAVDPIYNFYGTFNTGDTLINDNGNASSPAGLSHISIWARDPSATPNSVPEPGTLALLGVAMFGVAFARRSPAR